MKVNAVMLLFQMNENGETNDNLLGPFPLSLTS